MLNALVLLLAGWPQDLDAAAPALYTLGAELPAQERIVTRTLEVALAPQLVAHERAALRLPWFDGQVLQAQVESVEDAYGGGLVWLGRIAGDPEGHVSLSRFGAALTGTIRHRHGLYRLAYAGGRSMLQQLDESRFPECGTTTAHAVALPQLTPAGRGTAAGGSGLNIDLMVVWTPLARSASGGTAAIQSLINLAVSETNQAYRNSDVDQRLRLVYMQEQAGYAETGDFGTELDRLTTDGDGYMDDVHPLRDQYGADFVAMIVDSLQYCGIAWLMTTVDVGFAPYAFSVTSRHCATGYYTFGHELGHNMGCHHDRANAGSAAYPYSYGYRTASGSWRTILAYAPGTRVQYFSNPNKTYAGEALGIADPHPNSAENWKTLNNTAPTTALFRAATTGPQLAVSNLVAGQTATATLTRCTPDGTALLYYSLTGDGPSASSYGDLSVSPPITTVSAAVNAVGTATVSGRVPSNASGRPIWFHCVDVLSGQRGTALALTIF